jgi:hypothetical protein
LAQVAHTKPKGRVSALANSRTVGSIVSVPRTTTSSNAMVISAKESAPKKKIETQFLVVKDVASCAFLEEDEGVEREAALSIAFKGKKRLNSNVSHSFRDEIALF